MNPMLSFKTWAVVGSHGKNPIASQLVAKLARGDKKVYAVNPDQAAPGVLPSLGQTDTPVDVVDLVINPAKGFEVVEQMVKLQIKNLWIQPGAASPEILQLARVNGISVHEGCVLREAPW